MITFLYSKEPWCAGRFYPQHGGLEALRVMAQDVKATFRTQAPIHVILEPGDMTRYELYLMKDDPIVILTCTCPGNGFGLKLDPSYMDLSDLIPSLNLCTVAVISDWWNLIFAPGANPMYNWAEQRPL